MTRNRSRQRAAPAEPPPQAEDAVGGGSAAASAEPFTHEDKLDRILEAIDFTRDRLETKMGEVTEGLNILRADHNKLKDRVAQTERNLGELTPKITETHSGIQDLTDRIRYLEGRAEDSEGRARRNNLRIVGMPEGEEGTNPLTYLESWLKSLMPEGPLTPFFSIERAHRVPGRRPPPGAAPRPLLAKLLHYRDSDIILQEARRSGPIKVNNNTIMLFPDYTAAIQQQRSSFLTVKRKLHALNLKYALLFPARLRVTDDGKTHFFETPTEAWSWLEQHSPQLFTESPADW